MVREPGPAELCWRGRPKSRRGSEGAKMPVVWLHQERTGEKGHNRQPVIS